MTSPAGPCAWPAVTCGEVPDEAERTDEQQALYVRLLALATETLWRASGRRYGLCRAVVRPTPQEASGSRSEGLQMPGSWSPWLDGGVWRNGGCVPARSDTVLLPGHVRQVIEVRIDGAVLDPAAYRVDGHLWLVRQDGQSWPSQLLSAPAGAVGTWTVTYDYGLQVGALAQNALAAYLCEMWKASTGGRCRLPARVEGIFRQGVNIDFSDDNLDLLSKGRTGVPETDQWLALVNPGGATGPPSVHSPDLTPVRVLT